MKKNRRQHSADFKSKVALEALREQKTLSQLCEQYALHANQICDWKKVVLSGSPSLFTKNSSKLGAIEPLEALQAPFLEQIGLLQMEVSFLKKKLKQLGQI